jgi:hypothetical protein
MEKPTVPTLPEGVLDEVLATLPARVSRSLDRPDTHLVVSELLADGWTPPQLAARVAGLRIAGDTAGAARDLLLSLLHEDSPRRQADRERDARQDAARAAGVPAVPLRSAAGPAGGPVDPVDPHGTRRPVSDEARARWIAEVRRGLKGVARPRPEPAPRTRPDCAICAQESAFFVTRDVHLCTRCVHLLEAGQVQLAPTA